MQMIAANDAAVLFLRRDTADGQTVEGSDAHVLRASGLMRLFIEQLAAMAKLGYAVAVPPLLLTICLIRDLERVERKLASPRPDERINTAITAENPQRLPNESGLNRDSRWGLSDAQTATSFHLWFVQTRLSNQAC